MDNRKEYLREYRLKNKDKIKEYYLKNKDKIKEYRLKNKNKIKEYQLKNRYGITLDRKHEMYLSQNGECMICKNKYNIDRLSVDHCHTTNRVRELLCDPCNKMLGMAKENEVTLINAIEYLRKHKPLEVVVPQIYKKSEQKEEKSIYETYK